MNGASLVYHLILEVLMFFLCQYPSSYLLLPSQLLWELSALTSTRKNELRRSIQEGTTDFQKLYFSKLCGLSVLSMFPGCHI